MPRSTATTASPPMRLSGRWLVLARLAWFVLLALVLGKTALGLPLRYAELNSVCLAADDVCQQGNALTQPQVQALQAVGITLETYAQVTFATNLILDAVWLIAGVFIFLLRPDDWLAWIASAMMVVFISAGYETQIASAYPALGGAAYWIFSLGNNLMFLFIGLFPSGKFSPRGLRWYWLGMITITFAFLPLQDWLPNSEILNTIVVIYWLSFLMLGPFSLIYRYLRESSAIERRQTQWVVLGFALFAATLVGGVTLTQVLPLTGLVKILYDTFLFDIAGTLIPLSITFSVLRYRLWDIDVVIRRTLQYSLVTLLLGLVFFGGVTLLQSLFSAVSGQQSPAALVLSTLAIAAIFNTLRRRVQDFIDRRFYRRKYDAEKALADFAATARSEADLAQLAVSLISTLQEAMQPEQASLWLTHPARDPKGLKDLWGLPPIPRRDS